jgi:hypothetical protein
MRGRAGSVRIWHWAHVVRNPHCEAARESEWHLGWKVLGADGSQEVQVGSRRADVLAPGGFAVEFQASALAAGEVRSREDDWGAQGGLVWVFKADKEFAAGRIVLSGSFRGCDESLLRPENRATLDVTWSRAPGRVRAAHAPSFLDLGDGDLLFVGGWWSRSSLLTGYGWRVSRAWVAERVLRGSLVPGPLAEDPAKVKHELAQWIRQVDDEDRLERLRHSEAQEADRTGEGSEGGGAAAFYSAATGGIEGYDTDAAAARVQVGFVAADAGICDYADSAGVAACEGGGACRRK